MRDAESPAGYRPPGFSVLYPAGFLPRIQPRITDLAGTIGWRTSVGDWRFDASHTAGYTPPNGF